jgi:glycogen synthase
MPTITETTDCRVSIHFDGDGKCQFHDPADLHNFLDANTLRFFTATLNQTGQLIRDFSLDFFYTLVGKTIHLRLCAEMDGTVQLTPHELLFNAGLLNYSPLKKAMRRHFLMGLLERAFFHVCHPEQHISRVFHHSLCFLDAHQKTCFATIQELEQQKVKLEANAWLDVLNKKDEILLLEKFWTWLGQRGEVEELLRTGTDQKPREQMRLKRMMAGLLDVFAREHDIIREDLDLLVGFKAICTESSSLVLVYSLTRHTHKVLRLCSARCLDAMASPGACFSVRHGNTRTDIFYDHGRYIKPWLDRLSVYQKDPSLVTLARDLVCDDLYTVEAALDAIVKKIRAKDNVQESIRLLYSALYYWHHPDKGICRSVCLRVSKILEDVLTERPASFPPSRINRSVFQGERAQVRTRITKPRRVNKDNIRARMQWSVNGKRKRPVALSLNRAESQWQDLVFQGEFPMRRGAIHYAVQISCDQGKTWKYEAYGDNHAQGLIKYVADERGERILSFYADTFNLQLDEQQGVTRNDDGTYVYGSFATIAAQMESIRAEGYTRIYPLGALELGWAGEAGPDPSVFSIWDGKTVRRDMGGLEGLRLLQQEAQRLGMKVILCVLSHFSRANTDYPYHLPVYATDDNGTLTRRAGWDGEWDEWYDSFMVNMRDFDNVQYLAGLAEELAGLGFGLRIDVGHGFDTVFPVHSQMESSARLLGEVTAPGFDQIDLRGSWQSNIPLLYLWYHTQKKHASIPLVYAEQWHGNEARMIQSGLIPYNSLIKNLENIKAGEAADQAMGLNDNLLYADRIVSEYGGQTISLFNSHDEESPTSNYQNMIWPAAAFLVFSSYGPIMYHISRLPGEAVGSFRKRFDLAYLECWKHWVNNRFNHPWQGEAGAQQNLIEQYPFLKGFGTYLRSLYSFAEEHPALSKGSLIPIQTNNGRMAAFVRSYAGQSHLCVFNFPNPHHEGQQAIARDFSFVLKRAGSDQAFAEIQADEIYELKEKYNNVEGRQRRGRKEYWSGEELTTLGFSGVLAPVSSHVYEIIYRDHSIHERLVLPDSFLRYFRYGKQDRVRHTYIASALNQACHHKQGSFARFSDLFVIIVTWLQKSRKLGIADLSVLLAEISEDDTVKRKQIIEYLMRTAVYEREDIDDSICQAAADILHSINIRTIAMVSPESKFSGSSGGVGLYTTDIADVLSEMGFHVVIVTPLYECNREQIFSQFAPRYEGHSWCRRFPYFDESTRSIQQEPDTEKVNFLQAKLNRLSHGKRSRVEVIYLENGKYFDEPYGGSTSEDKLRRARLFSEGAIEALRCYNYYPSIIQTNEWPTWLIPAYLGRRPEYQHDPHFTRTQILSMMHNPHPAYSIVLAEADPVKWAYYCRVLGFDPVADYELFYDPERGSGHDINLTHVMLKTSQFIGTVSRAMRQRILDEPWLFGHAHLFREKAERGQFFGRRNGFNMASRQRFWFGSQKSLVETYNQAARRRLFLRCSKIKTNAKLNLQKDPCIPLRLDDEDNDHCIFGMLHRICRQKGFELLIDWKVYHRDYKQCTYYEPWNMHGMTVLEYFLSTQKTIQFVICGRVEDSFDGRRFDAHLSRIASHPDYQGQLAYYPEGSLSSSLYRNLYLGCQYFVMPSGGDIGEPCGISQQEAHAGGTPVIAHHQDGLKPTVSDHDFGDVKHPPNGIKFKGFDGRSLLDALFDAVEVYYTGQRRMYKDAKGQGRKLRHAELSFNAFQMDHRWLRLLHDYVQMYADIHGVQLPEHLDAIQLIVEIASISDKTPADAILRKGLEVPEAIVKLSGALHCDIPSVRQAASRALNKLNEVEGIRQDIDIQSLLTVAPRTTRHSLDKLHS